jgi:hypothetical protein
MAEELIESEVIKPDVPAAGAESADGGDDELEIEVVNDTPEEDRRPPKVETPQPEPQNEEEELKSYSEGVQKRIKRLKYEFHEERRRKEQSEREAAEALTYAQALQRQIEEYRQREQASQRVLVNASTESVSVKLDKAKRDLKEAYEAGDTDKMASAQEAIAILANQKRALEEYVATPPTNVGYGHQQETQNPHASPQPAPRQQASSVSPRAVLWKERNPWFGSDMALTGYAIDIHNKLVSAGVDPESDQYYGAIDSAVSEFKKNISGTQAAEKPATPAKPKNGVVISSSRTASGQTRTKVQLTESALAVAKRLGITPQQYAKELLKQQKEME